MFILYCFLILIALYISFKMTVVLSMAVPIEVKKTELKKQVRSPWILFVLLFSAWIIIYIL